MQNLISERISPPPAANESVQFGSLALGYGVADGATTRLLVIDDEPPTLRSLKRLLRRRAPDLTVHTSSDPAQAHNCIKQFQPQVILIDYTMPEIVGTDLCAAILCKDYPWNPLVFGMSGQASYVVEQSFREAGAHAFFTKPLDVAALLASLQRQDSAQPTR